jgi:hypothetical protein
MTQLVPGSCSAFAAGGVFSTPSISKNSAGNVLNPTGFGAVTAVAPAREIQLLVRLQF